VETKPVAAAARPVALFRSEITTGMSAPPIVARDDTSSNANAAATKKPLRVGEAEDDGEGDADGAERAFATRWPPKVIGRPDQLLSFRRRPCCRRS